MHAATTITHASAPRAMASRDERLRSLLVGSLAASAGVHAAMTPHHLAESTASGVSFALGAVAMLALALQLAIRPTRAGAVAAAVVLSCSIAVYAMALLGPVPLVAPHAEAASPLGMLTKACEVVGLYAAVNLALAPARRLAPGVSGRAAIAAAYPAITIVVAAAYLSHGAGH